MMLNAGIKLGPYEIISPLGAGGMGEVYRARDTRLDRNVAVKVLPDQFAKDATALSRFEREAKAVAALSHPNVLAVYDVGREAEISYVVTELLEGETLRQRLNSGPIAWRKAVEVASLVVEGLAAAHAKGIIHRDLKPENIFLTSDGVVKILDFGLARMTTEQENATQDAAHSPTVTIDTRPGTVIGTLNYMSPEQLRGLATDARSDIFSFGCVLYEMVAGRKAFWGETSADTMTAILRETPTSILTKSKEVGPELERVIERCLEKKAEQRFHSASDLGFTLKSILASSHSSMSAANGERMWGFAIPVGIAAIILAIFGVIFAARIWTTSTQTNGSDTGIRSIAVLPFDNLSTDVSQQMYVDAIWESITDDLAKIGALQVTASPTLRYYREKKMSITEIGNELDVDAYISGSALHAGSNVEVRVRLIRADDNRQLWSNRYEFDKRDIFTEQRNIARAVAAQIKVELSPSEQQLLGKAQKVVQSAYDSYVQGMDLVRLAQREPCEQALRLFDQALAEDPDFALAHVGRARAFHYLSSDHLPPREAMPECKKAALRALEIDPTLADAHAMLARYKLEYEWDFDGARDSFLKALEYSPSLADAHLGYAMYLVAMLRIPEAMNHLNKVHELDRVSLYSDFEYGVVSYMARDYPRTIRDMTAALTINPEWWGAHANLALAYSIQDQHELAITHARNAERLESSPGNRAMMGGIYAEAGFKEEALELYHELKDIEKTSYICPYELASIPLGLGDYDTTFHEMDRACDARADCIPWLQADPRLDPIRDDARFDKLLERVGFEPKNKGIQLNKAAPSNQTVLAVFPFSDNSPNPQQWLAAGLAQQISARLGRVNPMKLSVIGPESSAFYAKSQQPLGEIAKRLSANLVLRGSIQTIDDAVQITAVLVDPSNLNQRWATTFDGSLVDPFALQAQVAEKVVDELPFDLTGDESQRLQKRYTSNPEAEIAYMQGRFIAPWDDRADDQLRALSYFEKAIRIDPNYALAYCGLVDTQCGLATWGVLSASQIRSDALETVRKAMAIDESLAEVHASAGLVATYLSWDWATAEATFKRAIELNPGIARIYDDYARLLAIIGRYDESQKLYEQAIQWDPVASSHYSGLGMLLVGLGRIEEGEPHLLKALELDDKNPAASVWLAYIRQQQLQFDDAVSIMERSASSVDDPELAMRCFLAVAYAMANRTDEARVQLARMQESRQAVPDHYLWFAQVYAALGQTDEAFRWLDKALATRAAWLPHIRFDPGSINLRNDPRFDELHRKMGLSVMDSFPVIATP